MATTKLTFGEWMPDQPSVSGALTDAKKQVYRLSKVFAGLSEEVDREGVEV